VTSVEAAASRYGAGSCITDMIRAATRLRPIAEWWALPLAEPSSGTAGTWSVPMTGTATASGVVRLWIGRHRIEVSVASGDTAATVLGALGEAIAAKHPVTAGTVSGDALPLTAKHKGAYSVGLRVAWDEATSAPDGLSLGTITSTAGTGTTELPSLPPVAFAQIGVCDVAMAGDLGALLDARWDYSESLWGHGYVCSRGDAATIVATAQQVERQWRHLTWAVTEPATRAANWEIAAGVCGLAMAWAEDRPAASPSGSTLVGLPGAYSPVWSASVRDLLLRYGHAPVTGSLGRDLVVDRLVTTRWSDGSGNRDERSYQAPQMWALARFLRGIRADLAATFRGRRLVSDGPVMPPDAASPSVLRDYLEGLIRRYAALGLVEVNTELLREVRVERSEEDPARLDVCLPVDLVDGLEILAVSVAY